MGCFATIQEAVDEDPNFALAYVGLADAYSMRGRRADTLDAAAAFERLGAGDAAAMFNIASAYEQIGERREAIRWLQKALAAGYSRELVEQSPGLASLRAAAGITLTH